MTAFPSILLGTLWLLLAVGVSAQERVDFFNVDASAFPTIRAGFLARDASGEVVRALDGSLGVVDGADTAEVATDIGPAGSPARLSIVVIHQVRTRAIEARIALDAMLRRLEMPGDEVAIITFGTTVTTALPFTSVRTAVSKAASALGVSKAGGIGAGLLDTASGALRLLADRPGRRLVIHITDIALADTASIDTTAIWSATAASRIALSTIQLATSSPLMTLLAHRTGGRSQDSVISTDDIDGAMARIVELARQAPSRAEWTARPGCRLWRECRPAIDGRAVAGALDFEVPERSRPLLVASAGVIAPGRIVASVDTTLVVRAQRWPVRIDDVTIEGTGYSLIGESLSWPLTLAPGDSLTIGVRMNPTDSLFAFGRVSIASTACGPPAVHLVVSGAMRAPAPVRVDILSPRAGRRFLAREPVELRWRSMGRNDSVSIELALGSDAPWQTLSAGRTGTELWWTTPSRPYDSVSFRVRQRGWRKGGLLRQVGGPNPAYRRVTFSPDGAYVASALEGAHLNGIRNIYFQKRFLYESVANDVDFSPEGSAIAVAQSSGGATIIDAQSGTELRSFPHGAPVLATRFSPDGRSLLTLVAITGARRLSPRDTLLRIIDTGSGATTLALAGFGTRQSFALFAPDGERIVTGGADGVVRIWDARTGRPILAIDATGGQTLRDVCISPDGSELLTCSGQVARRWSASTGAQLGAIEHGAAVIAAAYSPDMERIVTAGEGRPVTGRGFADRIRFWSLRADTLLHVIADPGAPITGIAIDPYSTLLYAGQSNGQSFLWDIDLRDSASATVTISVDAADVTFARTRVAAGVVRIGDAVERVIPGLLCNTGNRPAVMGATFATGFEEGELTIVAPRQGESIAIGSCADVVVRFAPSVAGQRGGPLELRLADASFAGIIDVTGTSIERSLAVTRMFDFGVVSPGDSIEATLAGAILNVSDAPVTVTDAPIDGDAVFRLIAPELPFTIAPHNAVDMRIRFLPRVTAPASARLRLLGTGEPADPEIALTGGARGDLTGTSSGVAVIAIPNPARQSVLLAIESRSDEIVAIDLVDALGRRFDVAAELVAVGARTTARLDLAGLPGGAYRCRVRGSGRVIGTVALAVH